MRLIFFCIIISTSSMLSAKTLLRRMIEASDKQQIVEEKQKTYQAKYYKQNCIEQLQKNQFPSFCYLGLSLQINQKFWIGWSDHRLNQKCLQWIKLYSQGETVKALTSYLELENLMSDCRAEIGMLKKIKLYKIHSHTYVDMK